MSGCDPKLVQETRQKLSDLGWSKEAIDGIIKTMEAKSTVGSATFSEVASDLATENEMTPRELLDLKNLQNKVAEAVSKGGNIKTTLSKTERAELIRLLSKENYIRTGIKGFEMSNETTMANLEDRLVNVVEQAKKIGDNRTASKAETLLGKLRQTMERNKRNGINYAEVRRLQSEIKESREAQSLLKHLARTTHPTYGKEFTALLEKVKARQERIDEMQEKLDDADAAIEGGKKETNEIKKLRAEQRKAVKAIKKLRNDLNKLEDLILSDNKNKYVKAWRSEQAVERKLNKEVEGLTARAPDLLAQLSQNAQRYASPAKMAQAMQRANEHATWITETVKRLQEESDDGKLTVGQLYAIFGENYTKANMTSPDKKDFSKEEVATMLDKFVYDLKNRALMDSNSIVSIDFANEQALIEQKAWLDSDGNIFETNNDSFHIPSRTQEEARAEADRRGYEAGTVPQENKVENGLELAGIIKTAMGRLRTLRSIGALNGMGQYGIVDKLFAGTKLKDMDVRMAFAEALRVADQQINIDEDISETQLVFGEVMKSLGFTKEQVDAMPEFKNTDWMSDTEKVLVLDIETTNSTSSPDLLVVGMKERGQANQRRTGGAEGVYEKVSSAQARGILAELEEKQNQGFKVIVHNGVSFDIRVIRDAALQGVTNAEERANIERQAMRVALRSIDMMENIHAVTGKYANLKNLAIASQRHLSDADKVLKAEETKGSDIETLFAKARDGDTIAEAQMNEYIDADLDATMATFIALVDNFQNNHSIDLTFNRGKRPDGSSIEEVVTIDKVPLKQAGVVGLQGRRTSFDSTFKAYRNEGVETTFNYARNRSLTGVAETSKLLFDLDAVEAQLNRWLYASLKTDKEAGRVVDITLEEAQKAISDDVADTLRLAEAVAFRHLEGMTAVNKEMFEKNGQQLLIDYDPTGQAIVATDSKEWTAVAVEHFMLAFEDKNLNTVEDIAKASGFRKKKTNETTEQYVEKVMEDFVARFLPEANSLLSLANTELDYAPAKRVGYGIAQIIMGDNGLSGVRHKPRIDRLMNEEGLESLKTAQEADEVRESIEWERPDRSRVSWFSPVGLAKLTEAHDDFRMRRRLTHILDKDLTKEEIDALFERIKNEERVIDPEDVLNAARTPVFGVTPFVNNRRLYSVIPDIDTVREQAYEAMFELPTALLAFNHDAVWFGSDTWEFLSDTDTDVTLKAKALTPGTPTASALLSGIIPQIGWAASYPITTATVIEGLKRGAEARSGRTTEQTPLSVGHLDGKFNGAHHAAAILLQYNPATGRRQSLLDQVSDLLGRPLIDHNDPSDMRRNDLYEHTMDLALQSLKITMSEASSGRITLSESEMASLGKSIATLESEKGREFMKGAILPRLYSGGSPAIQTGLLKKAKENNIPMDENDIKMLTGLLLVDESAVKSSSSSSVANILSDALLRGYGIAEINVLDQGIGITSKEKERIAKYAVDTIQARWGDTSKVSEDRLKEIAIANGYFESKKLDANEASRRMVLMRISQMARAMTPLVDPNNSASYEARVDETRKRLIKKYGERMKKLEAYFKSLPDGRPETDEHWRTVNIIISGDARIETDPSTGEEVVVNTGYRENQRLRAINALNRVPRQLRSEAIARSVETQGYEVEHQGESDMPDHMGFVGINLYSKTALDLAGGRAYQGFESPGTSHQGPSLSRFKSPEDPDGMWTMGDTGNPHDNMSIEELRGAADQLVAKEIMIRSAETAPPEVGDYDMDSESSESFMRFWQKRSEREDATIAEREAEEAMLEDDPDNGADILKNRDKSGGRLRSRRRRVLDQDRSPRRQNVDTADYVVGEQDKGPTAFRPALANLAFEEAGSMALVAAASRARQREAIEAYGFFDQGIQNTKTLQHWGTWDGNLDNLYALTHMGNESVVADFKTQKDQPDAQLSTFTYNPDTTTVIRIREEGLPHTTASDIIIQLERSKEFREHWKAKGLTEDEIVKRLDDIRENEREAYENHPGGKEKGMAHIQRADTEHKKALQDYLKELGIDMLVYKNLGEGKARAISKDLNADDMDLNPRFDPDNPDKFDDFADIATSYKPEVRKRLEAVAEDSFVIINKDALTEPDRPQDPNEIIPTQTRGQVSQFKDSDTPHIPESGTPGDEMLALGANNDRLQRKTIWWKNKLEEFAHQTGQHHLIESGNWVRLYQLYRAEKFGLDPYLKELRAVSNRDSSLMRLEDAKFKYLVNLFEQIQFQYDATQVEISVIELSEQMGFTPSELSQDGSPINYITLLKLMRKKGMLSLSSLDFGLTLEMNLYAPGSPKAMGGRETSTFPIFVQGNESMFPLRGALDTVESIRQLTQWVKRKAKNVPATMKIGKRSYTSLVDLARYDQENNTNLSIEFAEEFLGSSFFTDRVAESMGLYITLDEHGNPMIRSLKESEKNATASALPNMGMSPIIRTTATDPDTRIVFTPDHLNMLLLGMRNDRTVTHAETSVLTNMESGVTQSESAQLRSLQRREYYDAQRMALADEMDILTALHAESGTTRNLKTIQNTRLKDIIGAPLVSYDATFHMTQEVDTTTGTTVAQEIFITKIRRAVFEMERRSSSLAKRPEIDRLKGILEAISNGDAEAIKTAKAAIILNTVPHSSTEKRAVLESYFVGDEDINNLMLKAMPIAQDLATAVTKPNEAANPYFYAGQAALERFEATSTSGSDLVALLDSPDVKSFMKVTTPEELLLAQRAIIAASKSYETTDLPTMPSDRPAGETVMDYMGAEAFVNKFGAEGERISNEIEGLVDKGLISSEVADFYRGIVGGVISRNPNLAEHLSVSVDPELNRAGQFKKTGNLYSIKFGRSLARRPASDQIRILAHEMTHMARSLYMTTDSKEYNELRTILQSDRGKQAMRKMLGIMRDGMDEGFEAELRYYLSNVDEFVAEWGSYLVINEFFTKDNTLTRLELEVPEVSKATTFWRRAFQKIKKVFTGLMINFDHMRKTDPELYDRMYNIVDGLFNFTGTQAMVQVENADMSFGVRKDINMNPFESATQEADLSPVAVELHTIMQKPESTRTAVENNRAAIILDTPEGRILTKTTFTGMSEYEYQAVLYDLNNRPEGLTMHAMLSQREQRVLAEHALRKLAEQRGLRIDDMTTTAGKARALQGLLNDVFSSIGMIEKGHRWNDATDRPRIERFVNLLLTEGILGSTGIVDNEIDKTWNSFIPAIAALAYALDHTSATTEGAFRSSDGLADISAGVSMAKMITREVELEWTNVNRIHGKRAGVVIQAASQMVFRDTDPTETDFADLDSNERVSAQRLAKIYKMQAKHFMDMSVNQGVRRLDTLDIDESYWGFVVERDLMNSTDPKSQQIRLEAITALTTLQESKLSQQLNSNGQVDGIGLIASGLIPLIDLTTSNEGASSMRDASVVDKIEQLRNAPEGSPEFEFFKIIDKLAREAYVEGGGRTEAGWQVTSPLHRMKYYESALKNIIVRSEKGTLVWGKIAEGTDANLEVIWDHIETYINPRMGTPRALSSKERLAEAERLKMIGFTKMGKRAPRRTYADLPDSTVAGHYVQQIFDKAGNTAYVPHKGELGLTVDDVWRNESVTHKTARRIFSHDPRQVIRGIERSLGLQSVGRAVMESNTGVANLDFKSLLGLVRTIVEESRSETGEDSNGKNKQAKDLLLKSLDVLERKHDVVAGVAAKFDSTGNAIGDGLLEGLANTTALVWGRNLNLANLTTETVSGIFMSILTRTGTTHLMADQIYGMFSVLGTFLRPLSKVQSKGFLRGAMTALWDLDHSARTEGVETDVVEGSKGVFSRMLRFQRRLNQVMAVSNKAALMRNGGRVVSKNTEKLLLVAEDIKNLKTEPSRNAIKAIMKRHGVRMNVDVLRSAIQANLFGNSHIQIVSKLLSVAETDGGTIDLQTLKGLANSLKPIKGSTSTSETVNLDGMEVTRLDILRAIQTLEQFELNYSNMSIVSSNVMDAPTKANPFTWAASVYRTFPLLYSTQFLFRDSARLGTPLFVARALQFFVSDIIYNLLLAILGGYVTFEKLEDLYNNDKRGFMWEIAKIAARNPILGRGGAELAQIGSLVADGQAHRLDRIVGMGPLGTTAAQQVIKSGGRAIDYLKEGEVTQAGLELMPYTAAGDSIGRLLLMMLYPEVFSPPNRGGRGGGGRTLTNGYDQSIPQKAAEWMQRNNIDPEQHAREIIHELFPGVSDSMRQVGDRMRGAPAYSPKMERDVMERVRKAQIEFEPEPAPKENPLGRGPESPSQPPQSPAPTAPPPSQPTSPQPPEGGRGANPAAPPDALQ